MIRLIFLLLVLFVAVPAEAVTEKLFPVPIGAVIELCKPGEEDNPCNESPNLRVRYSTAASIKDVQRELLSQSKQLGWRMYPLKGMPARYQSANPKRQWDLLWDLRPAKPDENGSGFHIYYWKIMGQ